MKRSGTYSVDRCTSIKATAPSRIKFSGITDQAKLTKLECFDICLFASNLHLRSRPAEALHSNVWRDRASTATDLEEGYNIGVRLLIDEFLQSRMFLDSVDFKETAEVIARLFKKCSGCQQPTVSIGMRMDNLPVLILEDNPLVTLLSFPILCQGLYYCNILSGVVRAALERAEVLFQYSSDLLCSG
nr:trafficking protein particle complex subunit 3-like [Ipomoea batatas]